jgi:hypothetical protein
MAQYVNYIINPPVNCRFLRGQKKTEGEKKKEKFKSSHAADCAYVRAMELVRFRRAGS